MENLGEILEEIKSLKKYRGQILKGFHYKGRERKSYDLEKIEDQRAKSILVRVLELLKLDDLSYNQGDLIEHLISGYSVGLFTPIGSGKRTALALASALFSLYSGKTVLIICKDDKRAQELRKRFSSRVQDYINLVGVEQEAFSLDITTDIIIASDKQIKKLFLTSFERIQEWFATLGLIAIEDITSFSTARLIHLRGIRMLVSLMKDDNSEVQYLLSGEPINNGIEVLKDISGKIEKEELHVITSDSEQKKAFNLLYWIPPYLIDKRAGKDVVFRRDFYEELGIFVSILREQKKLLVWHSYATISKDRINDLLKKWNFEGDIKIINSLNDLELEDYGEYDSMVLMGLPKDVNSLPSTLGNIFKEDSIVGVILPDDPFSHYVIRSNLAFEDFPKQEIILSRENLFITSFYFMFYIYLANLSKINKDKFEKSKISNFQDVLQILQRNKIFIEGGGDYYVIDRERLLSELNLKNMDNYSNDLTSIEIERERLFIDLAYFPEKFFHGAIHYINEVPFHLVREDEGYKFMTFGGIAPVKRVPLIDFSWTEEEEKLAQKGTFEISQFECVLRAELLGYREYVSYTQHPSEGETIKFKTSDVYIDNAYIIEVMAESVAHEIYHLLKIWIPAFYKNFSDLYGLFFKNDRIYIYSYFYNKENIKNLMLILTTILKKALEMSNELLLNSCPSIEGCPYCLDIMDCGSIDQAVDKKRMLEVLNSKFNLASCGSIQFKYSGFKYKEAQRYYEETAKKIFSVFENKLDLYIKNKATLVAVREKDLSPGVIGQFTGDKVLIIELLNESKATEVIAHEYGHNWDSEWGGHVLDFPPELKEDKEVEKILSKLVSEGFAQWAAFKVMDFYGLESSISGIYLWPFDEYGEGFRVLYWLEDELGSKAILDFVKTGKVIAPDGKEWGLPEILEKSGFKARVIQFVLGKKKKEKRQKKKNSK
ncbi:MAG: hypothetical protein ACFFDI_25095 [Promethearchaeota archaeon]